MLIERIKINNFRNIGFADIEPGEKINFILGNNAQGKTNFIETIYTAALLKSFRTRNSQELIKEGENDAKIIFSLFSENVKHNIELDIKKDSKLLKIDSKKADKNFYKLLNVIIFHPDEVNYISSYPFFRRNLIDRSIFYTDYNYIELYKKYNRCLKQRNNFLKKKSGEIDCWKDQLIKYGSEIIRKRISYIKKINNIFESDFFKLINNEKYSLYYTKDFSDKNKIEEILLDEFSKKIEREKLIGHTLVGPHKDDIVFYINDKPASQYGSQGQRRSLVISYKTAQIIDYRSVYGYTPILILDDMTSELDVKRKSLLLDNLLENSGQVFITSTDFNQSSDSTKNRVFRVEHGEIYPAN